MTNLDRVLFAGLAVAMLRLASVIEPVVPKISRAMDDFHEAQSRLDEATEAINKLTSSVVNFKWPSILRGSDGEIYRRVGE